LFSGPNKEQIFHLGGLRTSGNDQVENKSQEGDICGSLYFASAIIEEWGLLRKARKVQINVMIS
jgi:hypothetical protein